VISYEYFSILNYAEKRNHHASRELEIAAFGPES